MRYKILSVLLLSACQSPNINLPFLYQKDVIQGNVFSAEQIQQIQQGMRKEQVRAILGTPQLSDPFRPNQDTYYYRYFSGDTKHTYHSRLEVDYQNGQVSGLRHYPVSFKEKE